MPISARSWASASRPTPAAARSSSSATKARQAPASKPSSPAPKNWPPNTATASNPPNHLPASSNKQEPSRQRNLGGFCVFFTVLAPPCSEGFVLVAALSGLMDIMRGSGPGGVVSVSGVGRFDGREMCMVHRMFRREFGLAASVVRQVSCGDSRRAHSVAAHLRFIGTALHHHHGGEDRYVWPLLERRAPVQASAHVVAV